MGLHKTSIAYQNSTFRHYYLCHYLPFSAGKDRLSHSLLKFKRRYQPDLDAWIDCSLEALKEIPLPPDTIILRALHHDETGIPDALPHKTFPTSLDILGQALAGRFGCRYLPSLLLKSHPTRPCKELSRDQRRAELRDIYSVSPNGRPSLLLPANPPETPASGPAPQPETPIHHPETPIPALAKPHPASATPSPGSGLATIPSFLLIDDILTTGTTMRMIVRALRRQFPRCPIIIFTLARSDYDPGLNHFTPLHGQTYHLADEAGWVVAEENNKIGIPWKHLKERFLLIRFSQNNPYPLQLLHSMSCHPNRFKKNNFC